MLVAFSSRESAVEQLWAGGEKTVRSYKLWKIAPQGFSHEKMGTFWFARCNWKFHNHAVVLIVNFFRFSLINKLFLI